ncbi:MAG: TerB family tellurite resistance protein [Deltaproteobacteria bacterium]|nr:TerB family tellurite resistance protein [Deltaproteobacteria bacterium]
MSPLLDPEHRILDALIGMVVADGDADPDELTTLTRVYEELTGRTFSPEDLATRATARLEAAGAGAPALAELGAGLDDDGKRRVLSAAFAIAAADGFVLEEEDEQLSAIAQALGLSSTAYRDAVTGFTSTRAG